MKEKNNIINNRLQKIISNSGYCSRRKAEFFIKNGNVKVNNQVVKILYYEVKFSDIIEINNKIIKLNDIKNKKKIYIMFNKPRNTICSNYDPKKRKIIFSYFKEIKDRIYYVGRLDYDVSGLLLLTNDGEFANKIMHPKFLINKTYNALVEGFISNKKIKILENGIKIEKNFTTSKLNKIKLIKFFKNKNISIIELIIHEGKKNQIKKMFNFINIKLIKLKRISIGSLKLDNNLKTGKWRFLKNNELKKISSFF